MRVSKLNIMSLVLFCSLLLPVDLYALGESNSGQFPEYTREGGRNLVNEWTEGGGARLHWRAVSKPLQVRLVGLTFQDPAAVPKLCTDCPDTKRPPRKYSSKKAKRLGKKKKASHRRARRERTPRRSPGAASRPGNTPLRSVPMEPVHTFQDRLQ